MVRKQRSKYDNEDTEGVVDKIFFVGRMPTDPEECSFANEIWFENNGVNMTTRLPRVSITDR